MDGHIIDALLGLLLNYFKHDVDVEVFDAAHSGECFIDRHGADGDGACVDDGFADPRDVAAG